MKKKRNLLFVMLAALIAMPAMMMAQKAGLRITNSTQEAFTVSVNGQQYVSTSPTLTIDNLMPGNQFVRVSSAQSTDANGRVVPPRQLYQGWVNLRDSAQTDAALDGMNGLRILGITFPWEQTNPAQQQNPYMQQNLTIPGINFPPGWPFPQGWPFPNLQPGMPEADYLRLKATIDNQSFDSNKLAIAKQAAAANRMTAAQVAGLVRMLTFESNKLELAKAAYANCTDRNNYYLVNDAFTFSSSVTELTNFTSGTGR